VNRAKNKTDQSPGNRSLKLFFSIKHDVHAAKLESISTTHFSHRYPHGSFKAMKETMKAVALTRYLPISDPESLQDFELPRPVPGKRDLLVRIGAVSVNPVDVKVRAPKPGTEAEPKILGWDAAGVVERIGSDGRLFQPGDEVYYAGSITRPGTNSEYHLVDERIAAKKPASLTLAEAAALPLTTITAWETFFERLPIDRSGGDAGKLLLIIGGAGGVGSIGIQIAKLAGLRVIATASRNETQQWCKDLGADQVINHRNSLRWFRKSMRRTSATSIAGSSRAEHWERLCWPVGHEAGTFLTGGNRGNGEVMTYSLECDAT
jgi:NADPH:quinone reductase